MTSRGSNRSPKRRGFVALALAVAAGVVVALILILNGGGSSRTGAATSGVASSRASGSTKLISIIQDGSLLIDPTAELAQVRALGATTVRVLMQWYSVAPQPASPDAPSFDASNPNAYPASHWAPYDALVKTATRLGITVDFELSGGAPRWAEGENRPEQYQQDHSFAWMPDATMYGQFVHAVGERYSGHFTPPGSETALPAVHFWSFWNEPNFGQDLGPQASDGSTVPVAPTMYRALLNAGWKAIQQTQAGARNTILIGELAAKGDALHAPGHPGRLPGDTAQTRSLEFLRLLYCVGDDYRPLSGSAAARAACPTTPAASGRFRADNPALFGATGFAIHPYDSKEPPDADPATINPDYATFPVLDRVAAALDKVTAAYGSDEHYPIYNDEFGYITSPPQPAGKGDPSPAEAAIELNQAEYLSYENPRIASYSQYLLQDPPITPTDPQPGFSSGLFTSSGAPKATLYAYRLPLWLPRTTVRAGATTEIWGGARPAVFARSATAPSVEIQMQKGDQGPWATIRTVRVSPSTGYFEIRSKLPYSGNLRLAYTYPRTESLLPAGVAGSTIYGRTQKVTVTG